MNVYTVKEIAILLQIMTLSEWSILDTPMKHKCFKPITDCILYELQGCRTVAMWKRCAKKMQVYQVNENILYFQKYVYFELNFHISEDFLRGIPPSIPTFVYIRI